MTSLSHLYNLNPLIKIKIIDYVFNQKFTINLHKWITI
jgi:hypothetical protein